MPVGAIVSSAIGAGVALHQQHKAEKQRKEEQKERKKVQDYNKELNNLKTIQAEKASNPALQMSRMKQAGLNPYAYQGEIAKNTQPQQTEAQELPYNEVNARNSADLLSALAPILQYITEQQKLPIAQQNADANTSNANSNSANAATNAKNADTNEKVAEQDIKESEARIQKYEKEKANIEANTAFQKAQTKTEDAMRSKRVQKLGFEILNIQEDTELKKSQRSYTDEQKRAIELDNIARDVRATFYSYGVAYDDLSPDQRLEIVSVLKSGDFSKFMEYGEALASVADPKKQAEYLKGVAEMRVLLKQFEVNGQKLKNDTQEFDFYVDKVFTNLERLGGVVSNATSFAKFIQKFRHDENEDQRADQQLKNDTRNSESFSVNAKANAINADNGVTHSLNETARVNNEGMLLKHRIRMDEAESARRDFQTKMNGLNWWHDGGGRWKSYKGYDKNPDW